RTSIAASRALWMRRRASVWSSAPPPHVPAWVSDIEAILRQALQNALERDQLPFPQPDVPVQALQEVREVLRLRGRHSLPQGPLLYALLGREQQALAVRQVAGFGRG